LNFDLRGIHLTAISAQFRIAKAISLLQKNLPCMEAQLRFSLADKEEKTSVVGDAAVSVEPWWI
jgi:hypothetical protein